jgi:hypothetical protein
MKSWNEPFAVGLVVAVPTAQGGRWRPRKEIATSAGDMAVAKHCFGLASHGVVNESSPRRQPWDKSSNE